MNRPAPSFVQQPRELRFAPEECEERPAHTRLLMADPAFYDVEYQINPHMAGQLGQVDRPRARRQWQELFDAYRELGWEPDVLAALPGLPDLVFVANTSLPFCASDGTTRILLSTMAHPERQAEVAAAEAYFARHAIPTSQLDPPPACFEGTGDALWFPGRRLLLGGHGFRSEPAVYPRLAALLELPVLGLRLVDERFYHLDTCLCPLDERSALYVPCAFAPESVELLAAVFERLLPVPEQEAALGLAANGHCPDGRHLLLPAGCPATAALARELGKQPIEIDTSEFLKSGGSVFCMKLALP